MAAKSSKKKKKNIEDTIVVEPIKEAKEKKLKEEKKPSKGEETTPKKEVKKEKPSKEKEVPLKEEKKEEDSPKEKTPPEERTRVKKKIWLYFLPLVAALIIYLLLPKITLKGPKSMVLDYYQKYQEPGYQARYLFKNITKAVEVNNKVINGRVGDYTVKYSLGYNGSIISKERTVKIVDRDKPEIEIESDTLKVCPGKEPAPTYKANDKYDGDITDKVEVTVLDEKLILKVHDSSQNEDSKEINLVYEDTDKPEIKLKGNNPLYMNTGVRYNEPGYSANDNCDGDISSKVTVNGSVGIGAGTYKLTYSVTDEAGNKSEVTREVILRNVNLYNSGTINNGTIYLTFDDGPNEGTTNRILDILKEEGVKATFFVTCNGPDYLIKRMYDEGHTIALHTATHNYSYIYSSVDNYFADLNRVATRVKNLTGIDAKIIRFPGGSSNTVSRSYSNGIMTTLTSMVLDRGYRYFDWNVDAMDASSARSSNDVYYNVAGHLSTSRANVVLMHDTKGITRDALKNIIKFGKDNGYTFSRIEMDTYMVRHSVNN